MEGRKKQKKNAPSTSEEDSDVEKNFALLSRRRAGGGGSEERYPGGEEEEDSGGEEEEDSGGEEEEDSGGEEEEDSGDEEEEDEISRLSDEEDEEGGSRRIQTTDDMRKELSNMSFEDIMALQKNVGRKVYNEVAYSSQKSPETIKTKRRLNKNRPMEMSAKRPAPFLRQVVSVRKPTLRDPRFDDLSGEYRPEIFEKTYKFINEIKEREKEMVQKQLKKTKKNSQKKEKLQFLLRRLENQERSRQNREQQRESELQFKRQQRERAGQGGHPFFLKKSEKKKLQLVEKYQELKKSGKLENFLSKKRKRNAVKDRRKLPQQLQKAA